MQCESVLPHAFFGSVSSMNIPGSTKRAEPGVRYTRGMNRHTRSWPGTLFGPPGPRETLVVRHPPRTGYVALFPFSDTCFMVHSPQAYVSLRKSGVSRHRATARVLEITPQVNLRCRRLLEARTSALRELRRGRPRSSAAPREAKPCDSAKTQL